MEYLVVKFDEKRGVKVNGASGKRVTNETLPLRAGTHKITLEPPPDFIPPEIEVVLTHTAVNAPKVIIFKKVLP